MADVGLRARVQNHKKENGTPQGMHENSTKAAEATFIPRESLLTVLLESSLHIRAIYHIFVVILVMLILDTVIFDFFEEGKINIGLNTVISGFGDVGRTARFWFFEFSIALLLYPSMRLYAFGIKFMKGSSGIRFWQWFGILYLVAMHAALFCVPLIKLYEEPLSVASGVIVTCEMLRFMMKIQAVASSCSSRCHHAPHTLPSFRHYIYFLFAPTLIYKDSYPRTKKIRWGVVMFQLSEVAAIIFYNSFLWERFILPHWSEYGKQPQIEAGMVVRNMFACVLPGVLSFLCGFYCLLHAWHNAFAEMLMFADRQFYTDWWAKSQFSDFYRSWNLIVHLWLRDYLYRPLAPASGKVMSTLIVFTVSAIAHEVVLALSFGFFYPVLLVQFGVLGLLCVPLTKASGRRYPNALNLFMWWGFFLGNGSIWCLYTMEYFARQNCPPSENDSYFKPKSWTCPTIILKQNWTFHNPFLFN